MIMEKHHSPEYCADSGELPEGAVAVIGMAGRFPGAPSVEAFSHLLWEGREGITHFPPEEAEPRPMGGEINRDENFVGASSMLEDVDKFDAAAFGLSAREAVLLDPQHRLFLECAAESLDDAALNPQNFNGRIGVFGGCGISSYLLHVLIPDALLRQADPLEIMMGSDKDFIATRVSYLLNLTGPSMSLQTACSTSLLAVHMAAQSILAGECDAALAGGATVTVPQKLGYIYHPGGIRSVDGHCRPFDAEASGTVFGSGVGVVVLRRLEDALRDGDPIRAVLRGSAVNNDGNDKVGFTAPSVSGQTAVLAEALAISGLEAADIGYVEAHGTATPMGDPIEFAALAEVYDSPEQKMPPCLLGSVKSNVGHLDAAAGITGFVKTVLALEKGSIPPTLHFRRPNPEIDLAASRFRVSASTEPWPLPGPRRAGVSSFGVGGTNVHIILEEAPVPSRMKNSPQAEIRKEDNEPLLLMVSANSWKAVAASLAGLTSSLQEDRAFLKDMEHTLRQGRKLLPWRKALAVRPGTAAKALSAVGPARQALRNPRTGFLFAGQGSQYPGMSRALAEGYPAFRKRLEEIISGFQAVNGADLAPLLLDAAVDDAAAGEELRQTALAQPAIFAHSLACASLWREFGLSPSILLGHSIGEWSAATLAGVVSLEEAIRLVARRAALMQAAPTGAMLSVPLAPKDALKLLEGGGNIDLAVINGSELCVLSGPREELKALAARVQEARWLKTSHGFHSRLMSQAAAEFTEFASGIRFKPPKLPLVSNLTGKILEEKQAVDPAYWGSLLREPVEFYQGLSTIIPASDLLIECGPGNGLGALAGSAAAELGQAGLGLTASSPGYKEAARSRPEEIRAFFVQSLGKAWESGVEINFEAMPGYDAPCNKIRLPATAFERKPYWPKSPVGLIPELRNGVAGLAGAASAESPHSSAIMIGSAAPVGTLGLMQALWAEILTLETVEADQSFVELGGTSVIAMQLVARCRQEGFVFKSGDLMRLQTPRALAEYLDQEKEAARPESQEEQKDAARPLSPACMLAVLEKESAAIQLSALVNSTEESACKIGAVLAAQAEILRRGWKSEWSGLSAIQSSFSPEAYVYTGAVPDLSPGHGLCGALCVARNDQDSCKLTVALHPAAGSPGDAAAILSAWVRACKGQTVQAEELAGLGRHIHAPVLGRSEPNPLPRDQLSQAELTRPGQQQIAQAWQAASGESALVFCALAVAAGGQPGQTRLTAGRKRIFSLPDFSDSRNLDEALLGLRLGASPNCEPRAAGNGAVRIDWLGDLSVFGADEAQEMLRASAGARVALPAGIIALACATHGDNVLYCLRSSRAAAPAADIAARLDEMLDYAAASSPAPSYLVDPCKFTASYVPFEDLKVLYKLEARDAL